MADSERSAAETWQPASTVSQSAFLHEYVVSCMLHVHINREAARLPHFGARPAFMSMHLLLDNRAED